MPVVGQCSIVILPSLSADLMKGYVMSTFYISDKILGSLTQQSYVVDHYLSSFLCEINALIVKAPKMHHLEFSLSISFTPQSQLLSTAAIISATQIICVFLRTQWSARFCHATFYSSFWTVSDHTVTYC